MAEFRRRRAKLRVKAEEIDYKNVDLLKRFVSDKGKINPSRLTGANAKLQRKIAKAIKRARNIALIPYTDRKSTRLNSSHANISYAVFCLKKKKTRHNHNSAACLLF